MAKGSAKRPKSVKTKSVAQKKRAKALQKESFKIDKKTQPPKPLPGSFKLTGQTFVMLKNFWRPLSAIMVVYILLNIVFAGGLISSIHSNVNDINNKIGNSTSADKFSNALDGFSSLITGSNTSSETSSMQTILLIVGSLVIIWTLRQLLAGEKITIKQSYYQSMTPLVPFLLVILIIILQLLPLTIGLVFLSIVLSGLVSSTPLLAVLLGILFLVLASWSIYMLSSSIFAIYIVTLPNVEPLQALRSAKSLVGQSRWQVVRKVLFLPFFIVALMAVVVIPLIVFALVLVTPVLYLLIILSLLFAHSYLYGLYRRLLA